MTTPIALKTKALQARADFFNGLITEGELNAAFDAYIEALRQYRRESGRRFKLPTRGYLMRAL